MRSSKGILSFLGLALVASAGGLALLRQEGVKPIGRLSRDEVREVRGVVKRSFCPQRSWFKLANYRQWPSFARMRLTFRVVDIRKDSIGIITLHPDGTRDESGVTVWYTYSGWPTNTCHVEKRNGRWKVIGRPPSLRGLTQFPPSNPLPAANSRRPVRFRRLEEIRCSLASSGPGSLAAVAEGECCVNSED
jgi:hypothetical protein